MKWTNAKAVLWLSATLCSAAAIAFPAGQPVQQPSRGEIIMNNACMSCHEYRTIQTQAMDQEGWTKLVNSMIEKGAAVKKDDLPVPEGEPERRLSPLPCSVPRLSRS